MDIQSLSTSDLVALAFQVLQELANRLGRAESAERAPEPAASEAEPVSAGAEPLWLSLHILREALLPV